MKEELKQIGYFTEKLLGILHFPSQPMKIFFLRVIEHVGQKNV